jgi:hypothetical protein
MVPAQRTPPPAAPPAEQAIDAEPPPRPRPVGRSGTGTDPAFRSEASGLVALPYVGLNSFHGDGADGLGTGLRLGGLLGGQVSDVLSINGELTIDDVNLDEPAGVSASEYIGYLSLSPLFHASTPDVRFVIGPKLGVWGVTGSASSGGYSADVTGHGWSLGVNVGLFFPVNPQAALGLLVSYTSLQPLEMCVSAGGFSETCQSDNLNDVQVLGLTFGALL